MRNQIFFSYSHKDRRWLEQLQTMLKPLVRDKKIAVWDDRNIKSGTEWRDEINSALEYAKVAVLLVSPDFLASDFIANHELPPLLEAAEKAGLLILWVAVRHSLYNETEIERYQAVNDPSKPLADLKPSDRERVLVEICGKIKRAANDEVAQTKSSDSSIEHPIDIGLLTTGERSMGSTPAGLSEAYREPRVESVRTQLVQLLRQAGDEEISLRSKVFPILRGLFVGRNTFEEKVAECRDEVWTRRFIAAVETRRLMEAYRPILISLAKPEDERLVQSYDQLKLHRYLQELTGLFSPRPNVNEVAERLRDGDVEAVEEQLRKAEIHPKEIIYPNTVKACDEHQSLMREIWEKWPIF